MSDIRDGESSLFPVTPHDLSDTEGEESILSPRTPTQSFDSPQTLISPRQSDDDPAVGFLGRKESSTALKKSKSVILDELEDYDVEIESTEEEIAKLRNQLSLIETEMEKISLGTSPDQTTTSFRGGFSPAKSRPSSTFSSSSPSSFSSSSYFSGTIKQPISELPVSLSEFHEEVETLSQVTETRPSSPSTIVAERILSVNRMKSRFIREEFLSRVPASSLSPATGPFWKPHLAPIAATAVARTISNQKAFEEGRKKKLVREYVERHRVWRQRLQASLKNKKKNCECPKTKAWNYEKIEHYTKYFFSCRKTPTLTPSLLSSSS